MKPGKSPCWLNFETFNALRFFVLSRNRTAIDECNLSWLHAEAKSESLGWTGVELLKSLIIMTNEAQSGILTDFACQRVILSASISQLVVHHHLLP